jgi:hypothetical protein
MLGIIVVVAIAVPAILCWVILRARARRAQPDEDYGGPYDRAPLNPVPLREYTPTGSIEFENPPPGYTEEEPPRD